MKSIRRIGAVMLASIGCALALWVLAGLWRTPPGASGVDARLVSSLRHLDAEVARGEAERMQTLFPEGYVFTHALRGLAWADVAARSGEATGLSRHAEASARSALRALESPAGRAPFPESLDPPHGAFWTGWTLWLEAAILEATPEARRDSASVASFRARADTLAAALTRSLGSTGTPYLQSYPGSAWPTDALAGLAALSIHDRITEPRYESLRQDWIDAAAARVDPAVGLMSHAADPASGAPRGAYRGSSQALMLRTMAEVDPDWGRSMYTRFRERFVSTRLGLTVVTEYPDGERGPTDIDSGPTPLGVSLPATVVAIGTARAYGDERLAEQLSQTVEAFGLPVQAGQRRSYAFGQLPVGDAFLAWARAVPARTASGSTWTPPPARSRLPVTAIALALLALSLWPLARLLRAHARGPS